MKLAWQYRFAEGELLVPLRADQQLRASHRQMYQRALGQRVAFGERDRDGGAGCTRAEPDPGRVDQP